MKKYDKWQEEKFDELVDSFLETRADEFEEFCKETYEEKEELKQKIQG